jgi:alkaline phosphatase
MDKVNCPDRVSRRGFLASSAVGYCAGATLSHALSAGEPGKVRLRMGVNADPHLLGRRSPGNEANFLVFVEEMKRWKPDCAIDLGDFGCQVAEGQTTRQMHDKQLEGLRHHVSVFRQLECPRYHVIGNHDVGWVKGGDETITPADLIGRSHPGEDITKQEFLEATGTPHRYYSFDAGGIHVIVLDANNGPGESTPGRGQDGVVGGYFIDAGQKLWLKADLAGHAEKPKLVFCHEELHHTAPEGSGEGGDAPFPPVGKETSYVDNGWQLRAMFARDRKVLACFFGHKHRSRWTMYGGTHYITMAATHYRASFASITISDRLVIKGFGAQESYSLPLIA